MIGLFYPSQIDDQYKAIIKYSLESIESFFDDDVVLIHTKKTNKFEKLFDSKYKIESFVISDNWDDDYEKAVDLLKKNKINKIILFRNVMASSFRDKKMSASNRFLKSKDKKYGMSFISNIPLFHSIVFMKAASEICDIVVQFFTDIDELSYDDLFEYRKFYKVHLNQRKQNGFIFMPTFEYAMTKHRIEKEKSLDFVFFATAKTDDRKYLWDFRESLEMIKNSNVKIVGTKKTGTKAISQFEYDELLSRSRFTLAIPAYRKESFSSWRIFESLECNCICLILDECNMIDFRKTYPEIYRVIQKYKLIISLHKIEEAIKVLKGKEEKIIKEIKQTEDYKKISSYEWCKARWRKMLEVDNA